MSMSDVLPNAVGHIEVWPVRPGSDRPQIRLLPGKREVAEGFADEGGELVETDGVAHEAVSVMVEAGRHRPRPNVFLLPSTTGPLNGRAKCSLYMAAWQGPFLRLTAQLVAGEVPCARQQSALAYHLYPLRHR